MSEYGDMLTSIISIGENAEIIQKALSDNGFVMPNIPLHVTDNGVFWETLAEERGWKLQQHSITGHARILNSKKVRVAWGDLKSMEKALKKLSKPWDKCKKGDILAIKRIGGVYSHFAVYIGRGKVIHYAAEGGDFGKEASIHKADFSEFLGNDMNFEILSFPDEYGEPDKRLIELSGTTAGLLPVIDVKKISELMRIIKRSKDYHVYSPEETVERAKSRLGENKYSLVFNNCEHFAIWCKTGIHESRQVDEVIKAIILGGMYTVKIPSY